MVNEVNKLLYNTLVNRHEVYLPEVGTLRVVRRAASMGPNHELIPPHFDVEYTSNSSAKSLVNIISAECAVDIQRAEEIYSRWLEKVREGSVVAIDRVGTLRDKSFASDDELLKALNAYNQPIRLVRRRKIVPLFISLVVIIGAICALGLWYLNGQPEVTPVEVASEEIIEPIVETTSVEIIEEFESVPIAEIFEEEEIVEETVADWRENSDIRHWVVVGSYSTTENAERAISDIVKRYPESQCDYFKLGSMYAVAIFGSTDSEACKEFKSAHTKDFPQSWIYTPKKFR